MTKQKVMRPIKLSECVNNFESFTDELTVVVA